MEQERKVSYENQKILGIEMEKEVKKSFIDYAMSVIVARALPDVRDGLKPVHRRILYAMYEDHLTYDRPFCKSAATVGNVLGRYHPHGDAAVYDSMVRLAQGFSLRYPLIEGQGNFGNVDGDGAAAYRYTEARMSKIADKMLEDIEKDTVNFVPNFDNRHKEPEVLPARFPNLLVNGSVGIAVGMATNIPPHNLSEVIDGTIFLMENPDCTVTEMMQYIKGPDFPTYGLICGTAGIHAAYTTGRGRVVVRARAEVDEDKRRIIITEIPYGVNKSTLVESMANLVKDKRIEGVSDIRDETGKNGMKIVVEYKRDANGTVILNQFYKYTQLQDTCAINMIALVNGEPKTLGIKAILNHYIKHQQEVIARRVNFDLIKARQREHILEGQKIALDFIDEVIKIIRGSTNVNTAKEALMTRFGLTDIQAQAIVEMTLGKLAGLERIKIEEELAQKRELIKEYEAVLADDGKKLAIVKEELLLTKEKFGDARRTELCESEDDIDYEDLIEKHTCIITMTKAGYVKRLSADTYSAQHRGGKGIIGMTTKEEDFVEDVIAANSHNYLLMFTTKGKVYAKKAYQIPEASRTAKGTNIVNIIELSDGEKLTAIVPVEGFDKNEYFMMITKNGVVKRANITDFENPRKGGKIAINLDEDDELAFVKHTNGENDVIIATHNGMAVRFNENEARVMGRTARGVRGIRLGEDDFVVGATIVDDSKMLVTITENGMGKRSPFDNFTAHSRGTKGVQAHNITEKTGLLAGIAAVEENDDIMLITNDGTVIRTHISDIPVYNRTASGVIVMRLAEDAKIVNFALIKEEQAQEDENSENTAENTEA